MRTESVRINTRRPWVTQRQWLSYTVMVVDIESPWHGFLAPCASTHYAHGKTLYNTCIVNFIIPGTFESEYPYNTGTRTAPYGYNTVRTCTVRAAVPVPELNRLHYYIMPVPAFQGGPSGYFKHINMKRALFLPVLWGSITTPAVSALSLEKLELYYCIYR